MSHGRSSWPLLQYDVIGQAWRLYKQHWVVWSVTVMILNIVGSSMAGSLRWMFNGPPVVFHSFSVFGVSLLFAAIHGLILGAMINMADNQVQGRAPRLSHLLDLNGMWFDVVLGSCLVAIVITIGFSFCVIPGFIASGLFLFTIPLIVVNRFTAVEAMTQSFTALKSQWLGATVFQVALPMVALSGLLLCGLGLVFTLPLYPLSLALLNRQFFAGAMVPEPKKPGDPFPEI